MIPIIIAKVPIPRPNITIQSILRQTPMATNMADMASKVLKIPQRPVAGVVILSIYFRIFDGYLTMPLFYHAVF